MTSNKDAPQQQWLSIHDPATCTRKGLCPVAKSRGQGPSLESHSLYFEQHGTGPVKVVFVTGLYASLNAWAAQVKHFSRLSQYTILVLDNRGTGNSSTPKGLYSTSAMAEDVIVLLDFIGWTESRSVHVVGLSMGGMIALELAYRVPERFISLSLVVTTAGGLPIFNIPPWFGLKNILRMPFIEDLKRRTSIGMELCFNSSWLDAKADNDPEGRTNREVQIMLLDERAAVTRNQQRLGAVSQIWAGFTHHVEAGRLAQISKTIPKVLVLTGDHDHLVRSSNSAYLSKCMPEAEYVVWKETGHTVNEQHVERFNTLLERVFLEGQARLS
ncbi:alpha beta-hydrolase [Lactarius akahatsu]|uniref:Alpha beta-hydrolase n=1 Tax=Lactarius akahatsu TaxID=416441 RepID=A0AAD4LIQ9_9AGAM|nr:alpha beta-hydrolase [Lactarius akahatsu]